LFSSCSNFGKISDSSTSSFPESPEGVERSRGHGGPYSSPGTTSRHAMQNQIGENKEIHVGLTAAVSPLSLPKLTPSFPLKRYLEEDEGVVDEDEGDSSLNHSCSPTPEESVPLPLNTMDSILSVAISAEFNAFGGVGSHIRSHSHNHSNSRPSKELNKMEKAKLNELFYASQALNAPVDQDGPIKVVGSYFQISCIITVLCNNNF
jgi:hypothetical protein